MTKCCWIITVFPHPYSLMSRLLFARASRFFFTRSFAGMTKYCWAALYSTTPFFLHSDHRSESLPISSHARQPRACSASFRRCIDFPSAVLHPRSAGAPGRRLRRRRGMRTAGGNSHFGLERCGEPVAAAPGSAGVSPACARSAQQRRCRQDAPRIRGGRLAPGQARPSP